MRVTNLTWWALREILAKSDSFQNSTGNFRGEWWNHYHRMPTTGRMPEDERLKLRNHVESYGIDYVVWSFATPIAWRLTHGYWYSPDVGYSKTTKAKHLSKLRPAIAELNNGIATAA